ncbi:MAG: hypothetical protein DME19_16990 [Verrucomicrobia bacterium]|nr:MAG: hypothetical protein DME19_16990 [Verrucomicrobiota bacterium]
MQATFLLGPAGSGKTHGCLGEIRAELLKSPEGLPLVLLAPKQATFLLERQLLDSPRRGESLADASGSTSHQGPLLGYTRLQILSFERLAGFVLAELSKSPPRLLEEEGRVMVLRALLAQKQSELKIFRASARLPGFARQLSLVLRELQRHQHSSERLFALGDEITSPPHLGDKLRDLALLLRAYLDWLKGHQLQDANCLLDLATEVLRAQSRKPDESVDSNQAPAVKALDHRQLSGDDSALRTLHSTVHFAGLWVDGFAEMTPQELDFLAALAPLCERATLAFCLERRPAGDESWLSPWTILVQTFNRCYERLNALPDCDVTVKTLERKPGRGRFADNEVLAHIERCWAQPERFESGSDVPAAEDRPDACATVATTLRVAVCPNPEGEAVLAAQEILRHARGGGRFRDCAVLLRTLEGRHDVFRRVFRRYEIPFFLDRREPVAHHPLAELTRYAVRLAAFGWEHDDWFGALKTGLVSSDEVAVDRLENEALARGWKGGVWLQPLRTPGDADLEASINRWLEDTLPPFRRWLDTLQDCGMRPTGPQLAASLRSLWCALGVEQKLEAWSSGVDLPALLSLSVHATVFDQMTALLDNVELAFPNQPLALAEWLQILEAGLANLTVGVIPPALDQVLVGTLDRSRNPELQLTILPGWNEGVFPAKPAPSPLLSETERNALIARDLRLGANQRQQLGHERYYAYVASTRARKRLVITCAARDSADAPLNPSLFIGHLQRLFPGLEPETVPAHIDWREAEHSSELVAPLLAGLAPGPFAAPPNAIPASALKALESLPGFDAPLQKQRRWVESRPVSDLAASLAERLYGAELLTSVSAGERKEFEADPRARGDFQHKILEQFHRELERAGRPWRDLSVDEARELTGRIGERLLPAYRDGLFLADPARRFTARVLIAGAQKLIETLIAWMPQYRFDPSFVEVTFGLEQEGLPPWRIELTRGHALKLRGRIDRIDLCRPAGLNQALAVVVDYKSRPRNLDALKLHFGLELQLPSYLAALQHLKDGGRKLGIPALLPAGVFYVSLKPKRGSGRTRAEARAITGQAIRAGFQHSGRFNAGWLEYFDNRGEPKGDQFKYAIKKDGSFDKRGNDALEAGDFQQFLGEVEGHLRRIGNAIYDGDVSVAPFRKGSETACRWCEFRAICRFDPWVQPYRTLRPVQAPAEASERAVRDKDA